MTANLANFAYDPLNYQYLSKHNVLVIFLDLLQSANEKLIEHGITGICNFCQDPQIQLQLLEERSLESIQNLLESDNPRILSPALTTLVFLQSEGQVLKLTNESEVRLNQLLREVESGEKPNKLKNLLLILKENSGC